MSKKEWILVVILVVVILMAILYFYTLSCGDGGFGGNLLSIADSGSSSSVGGSS